jgi:hypothetical protein
VLGRKLVLSDHRIHYSVARDMTPGGRGSALSGLHGRAVGTSRKQKPRCSPGPGEVSLPWLCQ